MPGNIYIYIYEIFQRVQIMDLIFFFTRGARLTRKNGHLDPCLLGLCNNWALPVKERSQVK